MDEPNDVPNVAVDGFSWGNILIHENTGLDIWVAKDIHDAQVKQSERVVYKLRIQSRGGRVQVLWDGRLIFDNGRCRPLGDQEKNDGT